jgi:16S rRNA (uracil1498-N3)-methyltransferase
MSRRRFIADQVFTNRAVLTDAHAAHLARVLRARVGQEFEIAADGRVRLGRIASVSDERVEFELGEEVAAIAQPEITLLLAIFKFDRMEWAIEKCTELGVARIVPLIAARTDVHLASAAVKRVERWRRIAREAAEQSRRSAPPEIAAPVSLKDKTAILSVITASTRILLAESERQITLKEALGEDPQGDVALAIGPEGGWTAEELQRFTDLGWIPATLGTTILRAETAAIAAVAVVMAELAG